MYTLETILSSIKVIQVLMFLTWTTKLSPTSIWLTPFSFRSRSISSCSFWYLWFRSYSLSSSGCSPSSSARAWSTTSAPPPSASCTWPAFSSSSRPWALWWPTSRPCVSPWCSNTSRTTPGSTISPMTGPTGVSKLIHHNRSYGREGDSDSHSYWYQPCLCSMGQRPWYIDPLRNRRSRLSKICWNSGRGAGLRCHLMILMNSLMILKVSS